MLALEGRLAARGSGAAEPGRAADKLFIVCVGERGLTADVPALGRTAAATGAVGAA